MTERDGPPDGIEDTHVPAIPRSITRPAAQTVSDPGHDDTLVRSGPAASAGSSAAPQVTAEHGGRYGGEQEIGRGGLGRVTATYDKHLARRVARKELLPEDESPGATPSGSQSQAMARFLREARVTAQLEHPNIVPVYELGQRPDTSLYYTMKLVRGRTLKAAIGAAHDMQERLSLLPHFVDLCQAIAYAHSRGVIHRDIKPDNVMIGEFGETLVLDWGVAKLRGSEDLRGAELAEAVARLRDEEGAETLPGSAFGTPVYMAPEQAEGRIEAVDERSDVWALGVVLYQLLSGRIPYPDTHVIAVLVKAANAELIPLEEVCDEAPAELSAVVRRALDPDPARRYERAKDLADDVVAFQTGARVQAYRYSTREVVLRFLAEHRAAVTVSAIASLLLVVVLIGAYAGLREERDRALAAESDSRAHYARALVERARAHQTERDWVGVELLAAESLLESDNPEARGLLLATQDGLRPERVWTERTYAGCASIAYSVRADAVYCGTSFGLTRLEGASGDQDQRLELPGGWVRAIAAAPDGQRLLVGGDGAEAIVLDARGEVLARRSLGAAIRAAAFWGEDPVVVLERGAVIRLDGAGLEPEVLYEVSEPVVQAAASREAALFADRFGHVARHDGRALSRLPGGGAGAVTALATSEDGAHLAVATDGGALLLFDGAGRPQGPVRDRSLGTATALSFAGRALLVGTEEGEVAVVDLERRRVRARFVAHEGPVDRLVSVPGGLVSSGRDKRVVRFRGELPGPRARLDARLLGSAKRMALADDGAEVALVGSWGLMRLSEAGPKILSESPFESVAIARGLESIATGGAQGHISWRTLGAEGAVWTDVEVGEASVVALTFDPAGQQLFAGTSAGELVQVDLRRREARRLEVAVDPDARAIAAGGPWLALAAGAKVELRGTDGRLQGRLPKSESAATALGLDPEGRRLAVGRDDGAVELFALPMMNLLARWPGVRGAVRGVALPSEASLVVLGERGSLRAYDLAALDARPKSLVSDLEARRGARLDGLRPVPR